jgi:hypothetical protein
MAEAARLDDLADSLPPPVEVDTGGDDVGIADTMAEAPEPPPSPEPDALDRLLSTYDEGVGNGAGNGDASSSGGFTDDELAAFLNGDNPDAAAAQQREQEFAVAQQRYANDSAQSAVDIAQRDRALAEAQQTIGSLQNAIQQEVWRQHQARSAADFEKLVSSEQAKLADVAGIDDDHAKRWLLSEAAQDPRLGEAWEVSQFYQQPGPVERANVASQIQQWGEGQANLALQLPDRRARVLAQQNIEASMRQMWSAAFPDPQQHRATAGAYVNQALDRMHKDARKPRLDPDATADRLAVAQAVRGASIRTPPPETPPNLGRMTQGEFQRHTMEKYGF